MSIIAHSILCLLISWVCCLNTNPKDGRLEDLAWNTSRDSAISYLKSRGFGVVDSVRLTSGKLLDINFSEIKLTFNQNRLTGFTASVSFSDSAEAATTFEKLRSKLSSAYPTVTPTQELDHEPDAVFKEITNWAISEAPVVDQIIILFTGRTIIYSGMTYPVKQ